MKKSKKVLLSAAIAAAIMGSVSLPQIQAADIGDGVSVSTTGCLVHVVVSDKCLNNTALATNEDLKKVNDELNKKANAADIENQVNTKKVVASDSLTVGNDTFNVDAESGITSAKNLHGDQLTAGNATFDTTDANTTTTGTLTVTGDTRLDGTTLAKEIEAVKANDAQ